MNYKKYGSYLQYGLPHHLLSKVAGYFADTQLPWLKNAMIRYFLRHYPVEMNSALIEDPYAYPSFNSFFIRQLKPNCRPLAMEANQLACPVDGTIAEMGQAKKNQLLQAKHFYFTLETLLGNDTALAHVFSDGPFATLYLAPHNYHRVHMPLTGTLEKTIYVPGRLFSVSQSTAETIPHLYSRNERLISVFQTEAGRMAVILVGAMIVGSMQTVWRDQPFRDKHIRTDFPSTPPTLQKGEELGYFKLGSTVILLFEKDKIAWAPPLHPQAIVQFGQLLGYLIK